MTLLEPATAVMVLVVPPQNVVFRPLGVATTRPVGKVSVKAMPYMVTVFAAGLVTTKVKEVVPFTKMVLAPKALLMVGGATTLMLAEPVLPDPSSLEVTALVLSF